MPEVPPIVGEVVRSPGLPLDTATREYMEPRFGHDFSQVRVHTDSRAAESARAVNALAYTVGPNIVFGARRYEPTTSQGQRLLAHELTHVLQQDASGLSSGGVIPEGHATEREAEQVAERLTATTSRGGPVPVTPAAGLHRLAGPPVQVTPAQIAEMRALFQEVQVLMRSGAIAAEELAAITAAEAEAQAAIVAAAEIAGAGATATAIGEGALAGAAGLAADDVTGIGVADDVAIPFVLLAAAVGFGVGYVIGRSAEEIGAAWQKALDAVARAVELMKRAISRPQAQPEAKPQAEAKPETEAKPVPRALPKTDQEKRRNDCLRANPHALVCSEYSDMEEEVINFLIGEGMSWQDIDLRCKKDTTFGPSSIAACDGAPGETWHCTVAGTGVVVSIFACLCCHEDGSAGWEWRGPHISSGSKTGRRKR